MKKIILVLAILVAGGVAALAQPRGIGLRKGWSNAFEISYQHSITDKIFLQADLGFDYYISSRMVYKQGSLIPTAEVKFHPGATLTTTANMVLFEPQWTAGTWQIYAGTGISLGWAEDRGSKCETCGEIHRQGMGFMFSFPLTGGLSYQFPKVPIRLATEIRPQIGFHTSKFYPDGETWLIGFYDYGLWGLVPSVAVYYTF